TLLPPLWFIIDDVLRTYPVGRASLQFGLRPGSENLRFLIVAGIIALFGRSELRRADIAQPAVSLRQKTVSIDVFRFARKRRTELGGGSADLFRLTRCEQRLAIPDLKKSGRRSELDRLPKGIRSVARTVGLDQDFSAQLMEIGVPRLT